MAVATTPTPNGFYPLWEATGVVMPHRHGYATLLNAALGVKDVMQLGFDPVSLGFRVPNGGVKVALWQQSPWFVAASLHAYCVLRGAQDSFLSSRYTSSIYNPDYDIWWIPLSLSATWVADDWIAIHATLTATSVLGKGPVREEIIPGEWVVAEVIAHRYHSLFVHAGEVGGWDHELVIYGASYRFHYGWFAARLGYFYRHNRDGMQRHPLVNVEVIF